MAWKQNKLVGVLAAVIVIAAIVWIGFFTKGQQPKTPMITFMCESTGETFDIAMEGEDFETYAEVTGTDPGPCKFDDKNDAYLAMFNIETQKWEKAPPD